MSLKARGSGNYESPCRSVVFLRIMLYFMTVLTFCDDFIIVVLTARFPVSFRKYRAAVSNRVKTAADVTLKEIMQYLLCWQPLTSAG